MRTKNPRTLHPRHTYTVWFDHRTVEVVGTCSLSGVLCHEFRFAPGFQEEYLTRYEGGTRVAKNNKMIWEVWQ